MYRRTGAIELEQRRAPEPNLQGDDLPFVSRSDDPYGQIISFSRLISDLARGSLERQGRDLTPHPFCNGGSVSFQGQRSSETEVGGALRSDCLRSSNNPKGPSNYCRSVIQSVSVRSFSENGPTCCNKNKYLLNLNGSWITEVYITNK